MILKTIRLIGLVLICIVSVEVSAQKEYKAEIGVAGGGAYYLGDANKQLFYNTQPAFGGFLRYKFNPRIALKGELISTSIGGSFLTNTLYSTDLVGEFNFFDFEKNKNNRLSKTISPYIFVGFGLFWDMYNNQLDSVPNFISLPFGVGLKVKLATRWNLNIQWSNRLSLLSDNMENNSAYDNPSNLNGSNKFNNDLLSTLTVGISFDFWKKTCDCNNGNYSKATKNKK